MSACLLDKSVLSRLHQPAVAAAVFPYAGALATCSTVLLEVGWSTTSGSHHRRLMADLSSYEVLPINQSVLDLACDLQGLLVRRGHHRGPGVADLVLAATAISHSAVLLHYDRDFELIAEVDDRLSQRWVVPRGSVD